MSEGVTCDRVAFVVNPAAGKGVCGRRWAGLENIIQDYIPSITVRKTTQGGQCEDIVIELINEGHVCICCAGGDGTINECIGGYVKGKGKEKGVLFTIIPMGTGSDFIKSVNIPNEAIQVLEMLKDPHQNKIVEMDVGRIKYGIHGSERYVGNIMGAGVGAEVCRNVAGLKRKLFKNGFVYTIVLIKTSAFHKRKHILYKINDEEEWHSDRIMNIMTCNGQYQGGGMWIAPEARIDDGLFDVVVFGNIRFITALFTIAPKLSSGGHLGHNKVKLHKGVKKLVVKQDLENYPGEKPLYFEVDGEVSEKQNGDFEIEVVEKTVNLLVPRK